MVSNIHTRLPRREFLKKGAVIGAGAALGGVSLDALASYDPNYKLPGAVAAEPNRDLRDVWFAWHNGGGGRDGLHSDVKARQPERIRWGYFPREVYERSHVYYIVEAKMGRSGQSTRFARDWLVPNNPGLGVFRDGSKFFFTDKDYRKARTAFATGIFFSANFNDGEKQALAQMTNYQPLRENLNEHRRFNWALRDYFEQASVNDKERVLQVIENKRLNTRDELNVYWNLGMYIISEAYMGNRDLALKMRNDSNLTYRRIRNKNNFNFNTADTNLI